jgi:hypothetical protein
MALYFTNLIEVLLKHVAVIARSIKLRLHVLAFMGLRLRYSCALYNAVHITEENVRDLETKFKEYFNASLLFCGKESITPTVWTIGYVVPFHTRKMYNALQNIWKIHLMYERANGGGPFSETRICISCVATAKGSCKQQLQRPSSEA